MSKKKKMTIVAIAGIIVALFLISIIVIVAVTNSNSKDDEKNTPSLSSLMDVKRLMEHLHKMEKIATKHDNSRAVEYGYNDTVAFVVETLKETDYDVTIQPFDVEMYKELTPSRLSQTIPGNSTYKEGRDFLFMGFYSGNLDFQALVVPVPGLGCLESDYDDFHENSIALVSRGNCTFREKILLAQSSKARAILIHNDGTSSDRQGLFNGGLGGTVNIPAFALTYGLGEELRETEDLHLQLFVNSTIYNVTTSNIIAEPKWGNAKAVVLVGSHLDSVPAGPGINDNGSGSSTNLELALMIQRLVKEYKVEWKNRVRFAWWGAEEIGLLGSKHYVQSLSQSEKDEIALNINMDMVASPNFIRGVYNGTMAEEGIRSGSEYVMDMLTRHFTNAGLDYKLSPFTGRSDYGPFIENGIPAGGLFTGAEQIKSMEERERFGGMANAAYDPCYHQYCDTVDNIHQGVFKEMAQACAFAVESFAKMDNLKQQLKDYVRQ